MPFPLPAHSSFLPLLLSLFNHILLSALGSCPEKLPMTPYPIFHSYLLLLGGPLDFLEHPLVCVCVCVCD